MGNVGNKAGYLRRNELVPVPCFDGHAEENRHLLDRCGTDMRQEYLLNLLANEIEYQTAKRKSKLLNTAAFPRRYRVEESRTDEIDFPEDVNFQNLF